MHRRSRSPCVCRCREKSKWLDGEKCGPAAPVRQSSWTRIRVVRVVKSARSTALLRQPALRENSPSTQRPSSVSSFSNQNYEARYVAGLGLLRRSSWLETDANSRQIVFFKRNRVVVASPTILNVHLCSPSSECHGRRRLPEEPLAKSGKGNRPSSHSEPHRPHLCLVCTDIQVNQHG